MDGLLADAGAPLAAVDAGGGTASQAAPRQRVVEQLQQLQSVLETLFSDWAEVTSRRRTRLQRSLMLGLDTRWKVEEQLLLPALHEAAPAWRPQLRAIVRELDLLRELAMLVGQTVAANRQVALSVLQGISALHAARVDELVLREGAHTVSWPAIETEMRVRIARWRIEQGPGDDDEDRHDRNR